MDQADAIERCEEGNREVNPKHYAEYKAAFMTKYGDHCQHCGIEMKLVAEGRRKLTVASIDHIVPRARGGSDLESNLTVCCCGCNVSKGALHVDAFRLARRPGSKGAATLAGLWDEGFEALRMRRLAEKRRGKIVMSFSVDRRTMAALKRRAAKEGRSVSGLIRWVALKRAAEVLGTKSDTRPTV